MYRIAGVIILTLGSIVVIPEAQADQYRIRVTGWHAAGVNESRELPFEQQNKYTSIEFDQMRYRLEIVTWKRDGIKGMVVYVYYGSAYLGDKMFTENDDGRICWVDGLGERALFTFNDYRLGRAHRYLVSVVPK